MKPVNRLRRLFAYDKWACIRIMNKLAEHPRFETREEALRMLAHLLSSQQLWHRRISNKPYDDLEVWPDLGLDDCRSLLDNMNKKWATFLEVQQGTLDRAVSYNNSKGEAYESTVPDILHHLIIHGQHHRAQIATLIRKSGIQPPATDFIFYTRNSN